MYLFRLSKNEKDRVFLVVRLVKMIKQRQTCLQTRTSFPIARLVKTQRWACPKGRLQNKHMLSSSSLTKIKRYWSEMTGEKLGEPQSFNGSKSLLNMTLFLRTTIGLGCFIHRSYPHGPRHTIHSWGNATDPSHQCRYMFKRCHSERVNRVPSTAIHYPSSIHDRHPESYVTVCFHLH